MILPPLLLSLALGVWLRRLRCSYTVYYNLTNRLRDHAKDVQRALDEGHWGLVEELGVSVAAVRELERANAELGHANGMLTEQVEAGRREARASQALLASLRAELDSAKKNGLRGSMAEQYLETRDELHRVHDLFVSLIQEFFQPLCERYEDVQAKAIALHDRMRVLMRDADEVLGSEDGMVVRQMRLPSDAEVTFGGFARHEVGSAEFDKFWRALTQKLHPDKIAPFEMPWLHRICEQVMAHLNTQRTVLGQVQGVL